MVDLNQLQRMLSGMQDQLAGFERLLRTQQTWQHTQKAGNQIPFNNLTVQQLSAPSELPEQEKILLKMYDEFSRENEDDAKALSSALNKFGRYVQSRVAKMQPKAPVEA